MTKHNQPKIVPGTKVNSLTIIREDGIFIDGTNTRRRAIIVRCDCGRMERVRSERLFSGKVKSCGCLAGSFKHGLTKHRLYPCWLAMVRRCTVESHPQYKNYGARGIKVCASWRDSPAAFIKDMDPSYEPGLSLDRIDNNGNYCTENCRWTTNKEQQGNRRNNILLAFKGTKKTISEWSRIVGLDRSSINSRINKGLSIEEALTRPKSPRRGAR